MSNSNIAQVQGLQSKFGTENLGYGMAETPHNIRQSPVLSHTFCGPLLVLMDSNALTLKIQKLGDHPGLVVVSTRKLLQLLRAYDTSKPQSPQAPKPPLQKKLVPIFTIHVCHKMFDVIQEKTRIMLHIVGGTKLFLQPFICQSRFLQCFLVMTQHCKTLLYWLALPIIFWQRQGAILQSAGGKQSSQSPTPMSFKPHVLTLEFVICITNSNVVRVIHVCSIYRM